MILFNVPPCIVIKDQTDTSNDETDAPLFEQRIERDGDVSSGAENAARKNKDEEVSCGDFWEIDDAVGKYTYHHVMLRKRLFVPNKSEDGPNVADLENKRITNVTYVDGSDEYVVNDLWTDKGAQRAMPKYWKGTTIFYKVTLLTQVHLVPENLGVLISLHYQYQLLLRERRGNIERVRSLTGLIVLLGLQLVPPCVPT